MRWCVRRGGDPALRFVFLGGKLDVGMVTEGFRRSEGVYFCNVAVVRCVDHAMQVLP